MSQEKEEENKLVIIVDEREEKMVSHLGGKPTVRLARFLKPSMTSMDQVVEIPPLIKTKAFKFKKCPFQIHFIGWRGQRKWKQWVDQLKPTYEAQWKEIGIYDSIMASTCIFPKNEVLIMGLAECWCPVTNTFMFKWGEATLTLEDMLIIGGFSILGKPITSPLTTDLVEIEEKLIQVFRKLSRTKEHKASHSGWLNHFIGSDDDLGHAAFISLWLSRYVFPTRPADTMSKQMLPVAIQLSQGTQVALAPAVLASLYRDLRTLKEEYTSSSTTDDQYISVCAPFEILQLWVWERFLSLRPTPNPLNSGEPRAARWHKLNVKLKLVSVRSTINLPDDFQWRPYSFPLENWQCPSYYKERGKWVVVRPNLNKELFSFSHCLVPCELVGFDCIEQYAPHRVGMQFGMDQDIPLPFTRANANWESAWRTYDKPIRNFPVYIPPRLFESDVTARYFAWWNQSISKTLDENTSISARKRSSSSCNLSLVSENSKSSLSPPGISCKLSWEPQTSNDEDDKMTISGWYKRQQDHVLVNHKAANYECFSSAQVHSSSSTTREKTNRENPMIDATCSNLYKNSPNRSNLIEEDKDVRSDVLADVPSETYNYEELISILQVPGLELEAQLDNLEMVVKTLKEKFAARKAKKTVVEAHLIYR